MHDDEMKALMGSDALSMLALHLTQVNVQFNAKAIRAIVYLSLYSPKVHSQVFPLLMSLKPHQSGFAVKAAIEAINAISLKDFISKMPLQMGGGK